MMVQQETLAAGALQTFNPSMYTTPFVRSNAKLTPADLNATVQHLVGLTSEQITGLGLTPIGRVIEDCRTR